MDYAISASTGPITFAITDLLYESFTYNKGFTFLWCFSQYKTGATVEIAIKMHH